MNKEELLNQLEEKGLDFDTRALIVDDMLDIINQQLAELKAENERLKAKLNDPHDIWVENNSLTETNNWQNHEITKLKNQLKEKDEEIKRLKQENETECIIFSDGYDGDKPIHKQETLTYKELYLRSKEDREKACKWRDNEIIRLNNQLKSNTKQVCEKIREMAKNDFEFIVCDECYNTVDKDVYISSVALTELLDQIEKGEENAIW